MIDIILLIIILTIIILYGYLNFSNNITNMLIVKEGLTSEPTSSVVVQSILPNITDANLAFITENKFTDFIIEMNSILLTGLQDSRNIPPTIISQIRRNSHAMVLISNYAPSLNGMNQQPFNILSSAYPNYIKTMYDVQKLNEIYYSGIALNQSIAKLPADIEISDPMNYIIYNSLLNYLNTYTNAINYFYSMVIPLTVTDIKVEDNWNTTTYD